MERRNSGLLASDLEKDPELNFLTQVGLRTVLYNLAYGKPGRHKHYVPFLRLQRALLVRYFKEHPYPQQPGRRESWLHAHAGPIWNLLSPLKCLCRYSKCPRGSLLDDLHWSRTPGQVIFLLLAELHQAKPGQIQKLLTHPPRPSR